MGSLLKDLHLGNVSLKGIVEHHKHSLSQYDGKGGDGVGSTAAVYMLPIAQMACRIAGSGNVGCVACSAREAMKVGAWNIRDAPGVNVKNASALWTNCWYKARGTRIRTHK